MIESNGGPQAVAIQDQEQLKRRLEALYYDLQHYTRVMAFILERAVPKMVTMDSATGELITKYDDITTERIELVKKEQKAFIAKYYPEFAPPKPPTVE